MNSVSSPSNDAYNQRDVHLLGRLDAAISLGGNLVKTRLLLIVLLLLWNPVRADEPAKKSDPGQRARITRADLGVAYLRLERAYWGRTPDDAGTIRSINEEFDTATMSFFAGKLGETLRVIDGLSANLIQGEPRDELLVVLSLKAEPEPPVVVAGQTRGAKLRISRLYDSGASGPVPIIVALMTGDPLFGPEHGQVKTIGSGEAITIEPGGDGLWEIDLARMLEERSPGVYHVVAICPDGEAISLARLPVVARSLDSARKANQARLDQIEAKSDELVAALAACRDRNSLLTDEPSVEQSSQFLADPNALAIQIEEEIAALESGRDPYHRRPGDYWRTIRLADKKIPIRVFAPDSATTEQPVPLVIALHGAGGDENMFFEGYGVGRIKELAERQGALVVTPSTYAFSKPEAFDALLEEVGDDYAIDPARIYVLGHSMGGGATTRLAAERTDKIAAACGLAGGSFRSKAERMAPTLIVAAELDKIIPAKRLAEGTKKAQEAGLPIELRTLDDYGHTLMVGKSLPDAWAWLMAHSREANSAR